MSQQNVVISCLAALPDGRNPKKMNKEVQLEHDVLSTFRGPGKEGAFFAWVNANYPGYIYKPHSGSIKTLADFGIKTPIKRQTKTKKVASATSSKTSNSSLVLSIIFFPFKILWYILKSTWKIMKWMTKE